jgi:hypothetical protein
MPHPVQEEDWRAVDRRLGPANDPLDAALDARLEPRLAHPLAPHPGRM